MRFILNLTLGMMILLTVVFVTVPEVEGAGASTIIINEIMYDPEGPEAEGEWVELWNSGTQAINIKNWTLSDTEGAIDLIFPDIEFPPNAYSLIHAGEGTDSTTFVDGKADFYMGRSSYIYPASGDDITLADETGIIDFISFGEWNGSQVDPPPATYTHSNASAEEGFSIALVDGQFRESVPTPLEANGQDISPALLITEVYYDTWGENEYMKLYNQGLMAVNISHWQLISDGGIATFPCGIEISPGQIITVAQNSTNFKSEVLEMPDCEYLDEGASIPVMNIINKEPRFVNDKGEVFLLNIFGTQIDAFVYGVSEYTGTGWNGEPAPDQKQGRIAKRIYSGSYADTNTSADWLSLHPYVLGQSEFQSAIFTGVGPMCLFSSPDSSFDAVSETLDNATQYIWLNLYEFTNTRLCDRLLAAIDRGVSVHLFLEGSPVGGMNDTQLYIARQIVEAGGFVRILTNDPNNGIHARYDYDHGKYAVIDDDILLIMSENWGWTGVPPTGWNGNRGWGAVLSDAGLAGYFKTVFEHDWNPQRADSVAYDSSHAKWAAGHNWSREGYGCEKIFDRRYVVSNSLVMPVLSPDTSLSNHTILGMLNSAQKRVYVEEFYIYKHWGDKKAGNTTETPNLYLEAVIDAARRGCEVRVLMDASYYNNEPDDPIDNDDTAAYINEIALAEGLDMEAKVVNLAEHDFVKIHNKGLIADDKVLISSINWNKNSATANRETGIIIENEQAADFFNDIFQYDWTDDTTPPVAHFSSETTYMVNTTVLINASTSSDNVGIVNFTWALEDQPISWDMNFLYNFSLPGLYNLDLTVSDAWGNTDSVGHVLNILAPDMAPDAQQEPINETSNADDDGSMAKVMAVMFLVPVFIFAAIVYLVRARNR